MQLPMAVKVTRVHCLCARLDWQVWKLLFQCSGTEMCDTRTDACHGCTCGGGCGIKVRLTQTPHTHRGGGR